jgi:hypothetical protein
MKLYVKIAIFVVTLIALAGILAALYYYNLEHADMSVAEPDFKISASVIQKEFEDNETIASTKYINKIIEVTGKIISIKSGENNITTIALETANPFSSVICTFSSITDTSDLIQGKEIILRGECSGFLMDVLLNNCAVIRKP